MVLSTVCAKVVNSVFRAMVKNREIYSIGHSGKRNKWRDLVTPVSVFRGTNMRIELKQRKNWSKWQEVCIVRKSWPRSVSGSPRWSEELPAPIFTWGDQHSFCKMVTSAPGWIFTFVGLPSAPVEVVADLPFEVLLFWDSRPGSKKVKVISVPSAQIKETDTKRRPTVRL